MLNSIIDLAKRYLFPPLYGKVVLALLALAGTPLMIGFGADTQLQAEGTILGMKFAISYENKSSFWPGLLLFIALVGLAIWLFFRVNSPPLPRSKQIAELEDAYRQRGNQDSVCTFFREVHDVYVSPAELDDLMQNPETSTRARSLKNARSHVEFLPQAGFQLKNPRYPYRVLSAVFTGVYFAAALLCLPLVTFIAAAIAASSYALAAQLFVSLLSLGAIAWSSLGAYSACNSALSLTK